MQALQRVVLLICVAVACGGGSEPPTDPLNGGGGGGAGGGGGGGGGAGGGGGGVTPGMTASVAVSDNMFSPVTVHIVKGGTVTWNWVGGGDPYGQPTAHNVTFATGIGSGDETTGTYERVFSDAGTFAYECTNHRPNMKGTVVVH